MSSAFGGISAAQLSPTTLQNEKPTAQQVLQPVASLLGTTSQSLINQMRSGATLSGIAAQHGVPQTDLISAIEQGLQSTNPHTSAIAPNNSPSSIAMLAANIANGAARVGGHLHQHNHSTDTNREADDSASSSPEVGNETVTSLAAILGVDQATLLRALNSGSSVSELASSSGIPPASLQSVLSTGLRIDTTA